MLNLTEPQKYQLTRFTVGVIVFAVAWVLLISSIIEEVRILKAAAKTASERSELLEAIHSMRNERQRLSNEIAEWEGQGEIISELTRIGQEAGFNIKSFIPTVKEEDSFTKLDLSISASSNYKELIQFLEQSEKAIPNLSTINLNISAGGADEPLDLGMEFRTYVRKKIKAQKNS